MRKSLIGLLSLMSILTMVLGIGTPYVKACPTPHYDWVCTGDASVDHETPAYCQVPEPDNDGGYHWATGTRQLYCDSYEYTSSANVYDYIYAVEAYISMEQSKQNMTAYVLKGFHDYHFDPSLSRSLLSGTSYTHDAEYMTSHISEYPLNDGGHIEPDVNGIKSWWCTGWPVNPATAHYYYHVYTYGEAGVHPVGASFETGAADLIMDKKIYALGSSTPELKIHVRMGVQAEAEYPDEESFYAGEIISNQIDKYCSASGHVITSTAPGISSDSGYADWVDGEDWSETLVYAGPDDLSTESNIRTCNAADFRMKAESYFGAAVCLNRTAGLSGEARARGNISHLWGCYFTY